MDWSADIFDFDAGDGSRSLRIEVLHKDEPVLWIYKSNNATKIQYVGNGSEWVLDASWLIELLARIQADPDINE